MAIKTREALLLNECDRLTVLADNGYYMGEQLKQVHNGFFEFQIDQLPNVELELQTGQESILTSMNL